MRFRPSRCPLSDCPSHSQRRFLFRRKGYYRRQCDGRQVQRFLCLICQRGFSVQTYRLDYRLKRPDLLRAVWSSFVSKVTHRQTARLLRCSRHTVAQRLRLLGDHCRRFHEKALARVGATLQGTFQLDELETFEDNRRLSPVTVPVLIERTSLFVLHTAAGTLPARGNLDRCSREQKQRRDQSQGVRRSESRKLVAEAFDVLAQHVAADREVNVQTDRKTTYAALLRQHFSSRLRHQRCDSKAPRNYRNPLFPINFTLAMLRDGLSRLVRRTWAASKRRERLAMHLWIWVAYRNYVRGITNRAPDVTPAMALNVLERPWTAVELLAWKVA